jgi:hypothetical protein
VAAPKTRVEEREVARRGRHCELLLARELPVRSSEDPEAVNVRATEGRRAAFGRLKRLPRGGTSESAHLGRRHVKALAAQIKEQLCRLAAPADGRKVVVNGARKLRHIVNALCRLERPHTVHALAEH